MTPLAKSAYWWLCLFILIFVTALMPAAVQVILCGLYGLITGLCGWYCFPFFYRMK